MPLARSLQIHSSKRPLLLGIHPKIILVIASPSSSILAHRIDLSVQVRIDLASNERAPSRMGTGLAWLADMAVVAVAVPVGDLATSPFGRLLGGGREGCFFLSSLRTTRVRGMARASQRPLHAPFQHHDQIDKLEYNEVNVFKTHFLRRLLRHQLLVRPDRDPCDAVVIRLGDRPDEVSREGDGHVGRELGVGLGDALIDPLGQLLSLVSPGKALSEGRKKRQQTKEEQEGGRVSSLISDSLVCRMARARKDGEDGREREATGRRT
jgi:hypothetical protein